MTEDEAKIKWCPMIHYPIWNEASTSGGNDPRDGNGCCIASNCMMWRVSIKQYLDKGKLYNKNLTGTGNWMENGCCGLAGTLIKQEAL